MARGKSFISLIVDLRNELGRADDTAIGGDDLPSLKRTLNRVYETLWDEYDWPHLRGVRDKITLAAGTQFYDVPVEIDIEGIESVHVWWGGIAHPMIRGITMADYNSYDSTTSERAEPALKYDIRDVDGTPEIEVWPIPVTSAQELQIVGRRKFARMVADANLCLLDDQMVVLFSAAQILKRQKSMDWEDIFNLARARKSRLQGRVAGNDDAPVRIGLGNRPGPRPHKAVVRVS